MYAVLYLRPGWCAAFLRDSVYVNLNSLSGRDLELCMGRCHVILLRSEVCARDLVFTGCALTSPSDTKSYGVF